MNITLISHAVPYPPVHGGRIDIWRRIKALAKFGVKIQLIYWSHDYPDPNELAEIEKFTHELYIIPFPRTPIAIARRVIDLFSYPLEVTSRILRGKKLATLLAQVKAFNPDLIFLDGIQGGVVATDLSKALNIPIVTRSHNIEHLYHQRLLDSVTGWKKLKRRLYLTNLEKYEEEILRRSVLFYDISIDDLQFWQAKNLTNGRYLPPLVEFSEDTINQRLNDVDNNLLYDIVFLGGLNSANNVAGVIWFLTNVVPLIREKLPDVNILIAGLEPINKIQQLCHQTEGVTLKINPPHASEIYRSGRVLINPVSAGSGVNIKSIEMLVAQRPIISRPQGVSGLPEAIKEYFIIADEAKTFATEIIQCLLNYAQNNIVEPELLNSFFGSQAIKNVLSEFESIVK